MDISFEWASILTELRKDHHLTQEEVANILHISRQVYGAMEKGRIQPSAIRIAILSDIYNVDLFEYAVSNLPDEYVAEKQVFKSSLTQKRVENVIQKSRRGKRKTHRGRRTSSKRTQDK